MPRWRWKRWIAGIVWTCVGFICLALIIGLIWQWRPTAVLGIYNRLNAAQGQGDGQPIIDSRTPEFVESHGVSPICFNHIELDDRFHTEGAAVADIDRDGRNDIVTPDWWYRAPNWQPHAIRVPEYTPIAILRPTDLVAAMRRNGRQMLAASDDGFLAIIAAGGIFDLAFSQGYFTFPFDVNRDGWMDSIAVDRAGTAALWYQNPGSHKDLWPSHHILPYAANEAPLFVDVLARGEPQLVVADAPQAGEAGPLVAFAFDERGNSVKSVLSDDALFETYSHGLGAGDINGDGLVDIAFGSGRRTNRPNQETTKAQASGGWYEQSAADGQRRWIFHPVPALGASSEIHVMDVNGDGKADLIAGSPHNAGLFWFEQSENAGWIAHLIDASYTQLHALVLADLDGDGLKDIVTGKTWLAHFGLVDPDEFAAPVLYWYRQVRDREGQAARFVRYLIDDRVGIGRQITVADVDGNGRKDIAIGNRNGVHLFSQKVSCE
jgi:hypothetical protein